MATGVEDVQVSKEQLLNEIEQMQQQMMRLQQENCDLQIALETTAIHGDSLESQLYATNQQLQAAIANYQQKQAVLEAVLDNLSRQKTDLEIILETMVEHGDTVETELCQLNQTLEVEVNERKQAETKLQMLLRIISKEKLDLEMIMHTIIEHGDVIEAQWHGKLQAADQLALVDGLTQIANRRKLDEYLASEWQRLKREQQPISLILGDVDWFKRFNDTYGHQAGDRCLRQVAGAIAKAVTRPADIVARYGGEEFAIVLPNTDVDGAVHVAKRIRQQVEGLHIAHEQSPISDYVTLSLGVVALMPTDAHSLENLILQADDALYHAKQNGRNCVMSALQVVSQPCVDATNLSMESLA